VKAIHAYKARTIAFLVVAVTSLVDHTDNGLAQGLRPKEWHLGGLPDTLDEGTIDYLGWLRTS
jgi:hypothetical protein